MSTARRKSLARMLDLSVTEHVLDRAAVPVEVIAGDAVPTVERLGVPVGLAALALLLAVTSLA